MDWAVLGEIVLGALIVVLVLTTWLSGYYYGRADGARRCRKMLGDLPGTEGR